MFKFAITVSLMLIAMLFAACGGDTPEPAGQDAEEVGTTARAGSGSETSTQTGEARQPTPAPRATERAPSTSGQGPSANPAGAASEAEPTPRAVGPTAAVPAPGLLPTAAPVSQAETQPSEPADPDALVPSNPQLTDQVLLQDIYAKIDLEQFALDPEEPIKWGNPNKVLMKHPTIHEHPFLHVFPSLQEYTEPYKSLWGAGMRYMDGKDKGKEPGDFKYSPTRTTWLHNFSEDLGRHQDISKSRNGLIYFIYNPWFEPIQDRPGTSREFKPWMSWFGNNSTRGVLLKTVAGLLEEAKLPETKPAPRGWLKQEAPFQRHGHPMGSLEDREWTLEEFTANTLNPEQIGASGWRGCRSFYDYSRGWRETRGTPMEFGKCVQTVLSIQTHDTPTVRWEILHPQLPILKVTVHTEQALPLTPPGTSTEPPPLINEIPSDEYRQAVGSLEARRRLDCRREAECAAKALVSRNRSAN